MQADSADLVEAFRRWSGLRDAIRRHDSVDASVAGWRRICAALEREAEQAGNRLKQRLCQSDDLLRGIGDPLHSELGLAGHRWLRRDREESYSDWLAWILGHQSDTRKVFALFGHNLDAGPGVLQIERETPIQDGRTDILIRCSSGITLIEVKTASEPSAEQLERYHRVLTQRDARPVNTVLIAPSAVEGHVGIEYTFCAWRDLTLRLRGWAHGWLRENRLYLAAMTLTFCGAVERNVLNLGADRLRALAMAEYLDDWILAKGE